MLLKSAEWGIYMDKQAQEAKEMVKNLPFKDKVKHFWYYYKIHTIVAAFVLILIGVTVYQAVTQEKYDLEIDYYGQQYISEDKQKEIEDTLAQYIDDVDGDGQKKVHLIVNSALSNGEYAMYANTKFTAELSAAAYSAYILDESKYKMISGDESDASDDSISTFDMRDSEKCKKIFTLDDEPVYWCTVKPRNPEKAKKQQLDYYNNAVLLQNALQGK